MYCSVLYVCKYVVLGRRGPSTIHAAMTTQLFDADWLPVQDLQGLTC